VAEAATPRLGEFNPQDLAITAWAYATAGQEAPALFAAVAEAATPRLGEFDQQELANTAWAFAVADVPSEGLFGGGRFVRRVSAMPLSQNELCQLHQYSLWLSERTSSWGALPVELAARSRAAFCTQPIIRTEGLTTCHS
jgi:hypothetical protein